MLFTQVKLVTIVISSIISIASVYSIIDISEPNITALSRDTDFDDYKNKFGHKYGNYLASPKNSSNLGFRLNNDWWKWTFENVYKGATSKSAKFGTDKVTLGYSNSDEKALNKVCDSAYKTDTSKVTSAGTGEGEFKEGDVWMFCSFFRGKPIAIKGSSDKTKYSGNQIGKKKEDTLIAVTDENERFWQMRQRELTLGDVGFTIDAKHVYFTNLKKQNKTMKEMCTSAYLLEGNETSAENKPTEDEVVAYCSLDKPNSTETK